MESRVSEKPYRQQLRETFTKTLDERYAEFSTGEKWVHWIFVGIVYVFIIGILLV